MTITVIHTIDTQSVYMAGLLIVFGVLVWAAVRCLGGV